MLHFWCCAKKNKITNIFNYLNTDWLIISLLNTDVKKNYSLENRMRRQTSGWVTCAKRSRRNTDPGVSHTFSRCIENSWRKKKLSNVLSEFVVYLKLGFLWWKLKIFIANFSHVSPNRFWQIFSMLLQSHPTIKWRWKKLCCNSFDAKPQFDWTKNRGHHNLQCLNVFIK